MEIWSQKVTTGSQIPREPPELVDSARLYGLRFYDNAYMHFDECSQAEKYVDVFEAIQKSVADCPLESVTVNVKRCPCFWSALGGFGSAQQWTAADMEES